MKKCPECGSRKMKELKPTKFTSIVQERFKCVECGATMSFYIDPPKIPFPRRRH